MQKSVNNAVPSNNNNMLVPDDEIVVERIPYNQEDLLMKENQVLKVGQWHSFSKMVGGALIRWTE